MTTTAPICALMCKIFERHSPDGTIKNVRPINGGSRFRDAISDIGNHRYLWYEEFILTGDQNTPAYTTRLVCIEGDDAICG